VPSWPELTPEQRRRNAAKRSAKYRERKRAKAVLGMLESQSTEAIESARIIDGNKLQLTHGARDPERVGQVAEQLMTALLEDPGTEDYLRKPVMRYEVLAWAQAEAQAHLMRAWLDSEGISAAMTELTTVDETETATKGGTVRRQSASRKISSVMSELHKVETRAANRRIQLGITPLSRGRLGKDMASTQFDLARFFAEMDAAEKKKAGQPEAKAELPGETG
jgi:hypothetical protein